MAASRLHKSASSGAGIFARCARSYSSKARDYASAVANLNTLQSNFGIVQMIRENRHEMNLRAIPEMIEWCHRIGYEVRSCLYVKVSTHSFF